MDQIIDALHLSSPNTNGSSEISETILPDPTSESALIFQSIICSSIRNVSRPSDKIICCSLLLSFSRHVHDEAKLDRSLPYFFALLDDESDNVQVAAIQSITELLNLVQVITPINGAIFPEYILPRFSFLLQKAPSTLVRCAYARSLPLLAQAASKFLDMGQVLKTTGILETADPETENGVSTEMAAFDISRQDLLLVFESHTTMLLAETDASVRRSLLQSIVPLSIFFGKQKTNDVILSHLITYLNDKDAMLRIEFFDAMVGLAPYIGITSLEQYILPLTVQSLSDSNELVVDRVLKTLTTFSDLGLIRNNHVWQLLKTTVKFILHPNGWIRTSTVGFVTSTTRWMSPAEVFCLFYPIIRPFLECETNSFRESDIFSNLKPPLSRPIFNVYMTWASQERRTLFWKQWPSFDISSALENLKYDSLGRQNIPRSSDDEKWIMRLDEMGLKSSDFWKLLVLREYVFKISRPNTDVKSSNTSFESYIKVESLGIVPRKVNFDVHSVNGSNINLPGSVAASNTTTAVASPLVPLTPADPRSPAITPAAPAAPTIPVSSNSSSPVPTGRSPGLVPMLTPTTVTSLSPGPNSIPNSPRERPSEIQFVQGTPALTASSALTGTVTADVFAEMKQPHSHRYRLPELSASDSTPPKRVNNSNYYGDDPYTVKLLETITFEGGHTDPIEFGPQVVPITRSSTSYKMLASGKRKRWRPSGILVSRYDEHKGAINTIVVSPDHYFFLTGSDDGQVKIWDCSKLEKNVTNKSVQTFDCGTARVLFLCFIENTYTFACATSDNLVRLIRVDLSFGAETSRVRFKKPTKVREYRLGNDENAIWMEHLKTETSSLLIMATSKSRIIGVELQGMTQVFSLDNPLYHGFLTSFVLDRKKSWLLVGTSKGILDMWDLRFLLRVKSWGLPGKSPINCIQLHPRSRSKWICVSGGTKLPETTVWDVETSECKEIYRATVNSGHDDGGLEDLDMWPSSYTAIRIDDTDSHMLDYDAKSLSLSEDVKQGRTEVLKFLTGLDLDVASSGSKRAYLVSGGTDRVLRFWDMTSPADTSCIVSGLAADSSKPSFVVSNPTNGLRVVTERLVADSSRKSSKLGRPPRTTVIAAEQLELSRNHQASIADVALIFRPYEMIISGDRTGAIMVFA